MGVFLKAFWVKTLRKAPVLSNSFDVSFFKNIK